MRRNPEGLGIHRKIVSWLHVAGGAFIAALITTLWVCAVLLAPVVDGTFIPGLLAMFGRLVAVALLAFAALEVAAGIGLLRRHRWARYALCTIGGVQLAIFLIGTALAMYTLWALLPGDESGARLSSPMPGVL